jgi:general secretion pathway protein A
VTELLQTMAEEFGTSRRRPMRPAAPVKPWIDALNHFMLAAHAQGHNCVLIIDEAQHLAADVLEQLRLLTNLETHERKLLQIILIGQPELRDLLAAPAHGAAGPAHRSRATTCGALTAAETADYVRHRLAVAGQGRCQPFDAGTLQLVHRLTGGRAQAHQPAVRPGAARGLCARGRSQVDRRTVQQAAGEVFGPAMARCGARRACLAVPGSDWLIAALAIAALVLVARQDEARPAASATPPAAPVPARAAVECSVGSLREQRGALRQLDLASVLQPDEAQAWRALARRWGSDLPDDAADPCTAARAAGLACHRGTADLAALRQLDRPALLLLAARGRRGGPPRGAAGT